MASIFDKHFSSSPIVINQPDLNKLVISQPELPNIDLNKPELNKNKIELNKNKIEVKTGKRNKAMPQDYFKDCKQPSEIFTKNKKSTRTKNISEDLLNSSPDFATVCSENPSLIEYFTPKISNYKVYKHNDLVECKCDFSALEHRIIILALAQIKPKDEKLSMYRINIPDVLGNKPHRSNYNIVRNAIRKLHKSTIEIEEGKEWKSYAFITKAQGKYGSSYVEIQFHEDIQRFLLGLKSQYTTYTLDNVMNFKKTYSFRLYELCKQYQRIGHREMKLDYLKNLLSLENKYEEYRHFKRDVLNPAIEEINRLSDIEVSFTETRDGKRVIILDFFMNRKRNMSEKEGKTLAEVSLELENQKKLLILGFDNEDIRTIRQDYGEPRISGVLELFEKNIDVVKIPKAWIEKALLEGYVDTKAYRNHMDRKEDRLDKLRSKIIEIEEKEREIRDLEEQVYYFKKDIDYYKETGTLRPGDVVRFPENYSTEKAISYLGERLDKIVVFIAEKTEVLRILEKEKDIIKQL